MGCRHPDIVKTYKSSDPRLDYIVETTRGHGPLSSDGSQVIARLTVDGHVDEALVLHGLYLRIDDIRLLSDHEVMLCVPEGLPSVFNTDVSLSVRGNKLHIHNSMPYPC